MCVVTTTLAVSSEEGSVDRTIEITDREKELLVGLCLDSMQVLADDMLIYGDREERRQAELRYHVYKRMLRALVSDYGSVTIRELDEIARAIEARMEFAIDSLRDLDEDWHTIEYEGDRIAASASLIRKFRHQ